MNGEADEKDSADEYDADEYDQDGSAPVYLRTFIGALLTAGIVTPLNIPSGTTTAIGDLMQNSLSVLLFVSLVAPSAAFLTKVTGENEEQQRRN